MLLAGWEVRIVKNYDRGLENAARDRRPRAAFSSPRSQFFTIRTDPKPANNMFIFFSPALNWFYRLQIGFFYAALVIESATAPSTNDLWKTLRNERVTQIVDKERSIKEQIFFQLLYVSCIYCTSYILQNLFMRCEISCEVWSFTTRTISVSRCF